MGGKALGPAATLRWRSLSCALWLAAGCASAPAANSDPVPVVGDSCDNPDELRCGVGSTLILTCSNAAWALAQTCDAGKVCTLQAQSGGALGAVCALPPPADVGLTAACLKLVACGQSDSIQECLQESGGPSADEAFESGLNFADIDANDLARYAQSCLSSARSCNAVQACMTEGLSPSLCANPDGSTDVSASGLPTSGCVGNIGYVCNATALTARNCTDENLSCVQPVGDIAACVQASSCSAPAEGCSGNSAWACLPTYSGYAEIQMDCSKFNGVCSTTLVGGHPQAGCIPNGPPCDEATFVQSCVGNAARICSAGHVATEDCGTEKCSEGQDSSGNTNAFCEASSSTISCYDPSDCNGTFVEYCDADSHRRAFDCASVGMKCAAPSDLSAGNASCAF